MIEEASTLQDFPLQASMQAVKASANFESYDDFYRYLLDHLPQNSPQTRRRYAELIGKRYFPGLSLDNLLPHAWRAYQDERILADLMRVYALEAEPVIARFVMDKVWPLGAGQVFDANLARAFVQETYGTFKKNSFKRLLLTVRHLGFLGRYDGELVVEQIPLPANALLVLLHDRLAPTPRIVRLNGLSMDIVPSGKMLVIENMDQPGVVGKLGTVLGKNAINIAEMHVGRVSNKKLATTVVHVDNPVSSAMLKEIEKISGVKSVHWVELG